MSNLGNWMNLVTKGQITTKAIDHTDGKRTIVQCDDHRDFVIIPTTDVPGAIDAPWSWCDGCAALKHAIIAKGQGA